MVRKVGYIYLKPVDGILCRKLSGKSDKTLQTNVIHPPDDVHSGGSEPERSRRIFMHMIIHRNSIVAVNNDFMDIVYNY
jgi:hypothetical protein